MIYVYKCEDCGAHTEAVRKIEERDSLYECTKCSSGNTKRVIGKGVNVWHPSKTG